MSETNFLGHINDLASHNVKPLIQFDKKKALVKGTNISLMSNVCPHQFSLICSKKSQELKCQYHGWSWDNDGNCSGSGKTKQTNTVNLKARQVSNQSGLLFDQDIQIKELEGLGIEKLNFVEERVDRVHASWKHVMDVFLDVDHIPVVHKGVYEVIGIDDDATIDWAYYDWGNVQTVKDVKGSIVAVWAAVYPYTMIEWQMGSLFITVCNPKSEMTDVSVIKYGDGSVGYLRNNEIFEKAWEQDKHQSESIVSFSMTNTEEQKLHFRNWINDHPKFL